MCMAHIQGIFDEVIAALTTEAVNSSPKLKEKLDEIFTVTGDDYLSAIDALHQSFMEKKLCDGLPIVPPTEEAVQWMLKGTSRSPNEIIGPFPPKKGVTTIKKIAINAVMAGARPEYLPVIIAALEGLSDPNYDATMWRMSTSSSVPVIIISGPIADELNINSGMGLIGHGYRSNATIGRAIQLVTMNMGHTWPAENDMASIGRLNSYTFYTFAENIKDSLWESYAEEKGYGPNGNVVMVATAAGGRLTEIGGGAVAPWNELTILDEISEYIKNMSRMSNVWTSVYTVVMHPECAKRLSAKGWSKQDVQEYLYEKSKVPYEKLSMVTDPLRKIPWTQTQLMQETLERGGFVPEAVPIFEKVLKPGRMVPVVQTPDFIDLIVAGGEAGYTFVFGGANPNPNHQVKKITGATLTKYGK